MKESKDARTLIWEWPLRVWHWAFALCVLGSLTTGLSGEIAWMDAHLLFGYCAGGLLLFRLVWGFVGGDYSRWSHYWTTPARFMAHFAGRGAVDPHTAPGIVLSVLLMLAVAGQVSTGLFASDDIFIEGPLVRYADSGTVDLMNAIHHRLFWLVIAAIATHLLAHLVYGLRGDPGAFAMITGYKKTTVPVSATRQRGVWALGVAALSAALVWGALALI